MLIPLFLAALLYVLVAFLVLPFIRRHRTRYSQYLPLSAPADLTTLSTSWRTTLSDALYHLFAPSSWRRTQPIANYTDDELFDDEEGEGMVGFDPIDERRREALEQRRSLGGLGLHVEAQRVGRDLEEGFKDDSEDEEDERRRSLVRRGETWGNV